MRRERKKMESLSEGGEGGSFCATAPSQRAPNSLFRVFCEKTVFEILRNLTKSYRDLCVRGVLFFLSPAVVSGFSFV